MTYLPISHLDGGSQFYLSGDVTIAPGAAIAPGVLLQAEPGSEIMIAAGVCVGAGAVVHARNGSLVIEVGVSLGSGVLVVGNGQIGAHASVGTAATILNPTVAPGEVVPACALVGDTSRQIADLGSASGQFQPSPQVATLIEEPSPQGEVESGPRSAEVPSEEDSDGRMSVDREAVDDGLPDPEAPDRGDSASVEDRNGKSPNPGPQSNSSYGRDQVNELIETLFPHRRSLNDSQ